MTRTKNQIARLLESCNFKVRSIISDISTKAAEKLSNAISNGQTVTSLPVLVCHHSVRKRHGDEKLRLVVEGRFTKYAELTSEKRETADQPKPVRAVPGNKCLRVVMVQIAWAAVKVKNGYWMTEHQHLKKRVGSKRPYWQLLEKYSNPSLRYSPQNTAVKTDMQKVLR